MCIRDRQKHSGKQKLQDFVESCCIDALLGSCPRSDVSFESVVICIESVQKICVEPTAATPRDVGGHKSC